MCSTQRISSLFKNDVLPSSWRAAAWLSFLDAHRDLCLNRRFIKIPNDKLNSNQQCIMGPELRTSAWINVMVISDAVLRQRSYRHSLHRMNASKAIVLCAILKEEHLKKKKKPVHKSIYSSLSSKDCVCCENMIIMSEACTAVSWWVPLVFSSLSSVSHLCHDVCSSVIRRPCCWRVSGCKTICSNVK